MDKEIQDMFKEKNEQIIKNNLQNDIDTNIKSLLDTITNIFNNNFDIAIKNIILIYEDSNILDSDKIIIDKMNQLKINCFNIINKLIESKKNKLLEAISNIEFNEVDMDKYYDLVFSTTKDIKNIFIDGEINDKKKQAIIDLNNYTDKVLENNKSTITKNRINDYITYRLFGKIEEKINSEFLLRDNNLANKGKESYDKFVEISNKTTNL